MITCTPAISKRLFEGEEMDCVELEEIVMGQLMRWADALVVAEGVMVGEIVEVLVVWFVGA